MSTKMKELEGVMGRGVMVYHVILTDAKRVAWEPCKKGGVWHLKNRGECVPLLGWLAFQTAQRRAAGKMGPHTTATINNVQVCVKQRGETMVYICPNSPAWSDHLAACRFDTGATLPIKELQGACRAKRISPAGTLAELQGRLAATIEDIAGVFESEERAVLKRGASSSGAAHKRQKKAAVQNE